MAEAALAAALDERDDIYAMKERGLRVLGDEQCCELACNGGACESCPCCCAGWCVWGHVEIPDTHDTQNYSIWLSEAAQHNPVAARLAESEAALARVESACIEMIRSADEAQARMPGEVLWAVNATRECVAGVREALAAPTPELPADLTQSVVPALVESVQWAVKQIDAALVDTRMSAAAMSWLRTIRESLVNSSGDMPERPPNALAGLIFGNDVAPVSEQPKEQQ